MATEKQTPEKKDSQASKDDFSQNSSEKKIRQMIGYLTYYSGGLIDFDQAVLLATNAEATHRAMGKKPIAVEAKDWLDRDALKKVIQTMSKLGRIGDAKDDLQFAVVKPSMLAIKPMPEKFFTDPFNDSEKEALNRSLGYLPFCVGS